MLRVAWGFGVARLLVFGVGVLWQVGEFDVVLELIEEQHLVLTVV